MTTAITLEMTTLLSHHKEMLTNGSGIKESVIQQRGYFSITRPEQAQELGFSLQQSYAVSEKYPALIIPYFSTAGEIATYVMRPDSPRAIDNKKKRKLPDGTYPQKVFKYEMIKGAGNVLDCHPAINGGLQNPDRLLIFTEGAKKADSLISREYAAINVNGVWGWRGTNQRQGKAALAGFDDIALNKRRSILLFDSDVRTNENVKNALRRFKRFLETRGAIVIPVLLPNLGEGKTGIDDYFVSGKTPQELNELITYFETFAPDLGGADRKWDTESICDWFRECGYGFALNDMDESIYVNGQRFDDTAADIVEARARDDGLPVEHTRKAITVYANSNRFHPIKDYLDGLEWNRNENITALASYVTDEDGVFSTYLRCWLIGAVAKVFGERAQNFVPVLSGVQGNGKSSFVHFLCPASLQEAHLSENTIEPDSKDCRLELTRRWVWEIGELASVTKRQDRDALKRFLTTHQISERVPYSRYPLTKPAITSFMATVNPDGGGFLDDPTGNRRFVVINITSIDWDYTAIDISQVWAEAVAAFRSGESFNLTANEQRQRAELNQRHEVENPFEAMVSRMFDVDPAQTGDEWLMTGPRILELLDQDVGNKARLGLLSSALRSIGLVKDKNKRTINGERARFWHGIRQRNQTTA